MRPSLDSGLDSRAVAEALKKYFDWPATPPSSDVLEAIESGPIDAADALGLDELDRLLDPAPLKVETGWCRLPDGVGYVAVRTPMPGNAAEMWDWWFDWHPRDAERYRVWYPEAHFDTGFVPSSRRHAKPFWGSTVYPDEDVGTGRERLRIEFMRPSEFGFSTDAIDDPRVGTIVCGHVGSTTRHARFAAMAHVFLRDADGLVLRSRFWLGAVLRPDLPGVLGDAVARVVNRPFVRKRVIPRDAPRRLALHCATEYTRLAAMLPQMYSEFGAAAVS